jgi:uncharacterized protein YjeT (DUF2065 family)
MHDFITAIGLVLVLEGLSYAAFPKAMRAAIVQAGKLPDGILRRYGLIAAVLGLVVVYLERGL